MRKLFCALTRETNKYIENVRKLSFVRLIEQNE